MSIHCQAMSDWLELSIRHSVIYDEIIMIHPIHGWSPLCSTINNKRLNFSRLFFCYFGKSLYSSFLILNCCSCIWYAAILVEFGGAST